jgi:hypothetical protein
MGPIAQADRHDAPWLLDELVPRFAAMADDVVVGCEHAVRQPVVAHELPEVFDRVELRAFGRQRHDRDAGRHDEPVRHVPACLIHQQHGMGARRDLGGDFGEMQGHRMKIAAGHDEGRALAFPGADRAEDVGRSRALIVGCRGPRAAFCPAPRDLVLLSDARFVLPPNLYRGWIDALFKRDRVQAGGEVFLKSSRAPSACA